MELFSTVIIVIAAGLLMSAFRVLREYERGVVFMLGRIYKVKGPGPGHHHSCSPADGARRPAHLRARHALAGSDHPRQRVGQGQRRAVLSRGGLGACHHQRGELHGRHGPAGADHAALGARPHELDELLAEREKLNADIQEILDKQTDQWGIKVSNVEIKHVDIDESMIRAIAKQAEAERERRAKIIHAEGEEQAAAKLVEAAQRLSQQSEAIQLRYLQTLTQIAGDKSSTIVFPLPMNVLGAFQTAAGGQGGSERGG
jgi:regulator of protease activity HflC (stomatin/prohibitin superfamily)